MTKSAWWRLLVAVLIMTGAVLISVSSTPRLGLDLSGGTQITLEAQDTPTLEATAEATDRAVEVLRGRVDALGVSEPSLVRSGENRILIELPGLEDPREAAEVIGKTAQLTFHPVLGTDPSVVGKPAQEPEAGEEPDPGAPDAKGRFVAQDEDGGPLVLGPAQLEGDDVSDAVAGLEQSGVGWVVDVDFSRSGNSKWASLTGDAACFQLGDPQRRVAIVLDDEVISSPRSRTPRATSACPAAAPRSPATSTPNRPPSSRC